MEIIAVIEKVFFVLLFSGLLAVFAALVIRLNNAVKTTKLLIPLRMRIGFITVAVYLAGCIVVVLLSKP
ncbi:MAG: hypothetical protein AAB966_00080 [Patescibacteria group bacterium]